ncbi:helix-hairpin-helix domain-containing protein [Rhodopirellula sp. JC740]|uniref:Helix-hairpin-helix domain-containing protein n=1 Tax=Rhodopirellula halodulae TaxID=2894198 RepID=A0ABS8NGG1_9BACT|nr:helix-hairpin-helix domain-containing protein [Rhodopirellula sp. JC740]MCC9642631.1 helix-hairpin-helix domain-containing protein [Rhodopirellula sp. JC740]
MEVAAKDGSDHAEMGRGDSVSMIATPTPKIALTVPGIQSTLFAGMVALLVFCSFTSQQPAAIPKVSIAADAELSPPLSVDLNASDCRELTLLPGIGPKLAERVVRHREQNGPFRSIEHLGDVHGVGPKLLASLRRWVHVEVPERVGPAIQPAGIDRDLAEWQFGLTISQEPAMMNP